MQGASETCEDLLQLHARSSGTWNEAIRVNALAGKWLCPCCSCTRNKKRLRLSRCCSCAPGLPLRPLPLRLRARAAMATLYFQVWGGWCSVHMDATVWCMTLPFTDGASVVCVIDWCLLNTSLLKFCRGLALCLPLHSLHQWADEFHMGPIVMCT